MIKIWHSANHTKTLQYSLIISMSLLIESLNKLKDFRPLDLLTQQAQAVLRVAASRSVYFGIFRRPLVCLVSRLFV